MKQIQFALYKFIDDTHNLINESQKLNFMRLNVLNSKILVNPVIRGSFEEEEEYLKYFIDKRFDIADEIIKNASYETINAKVDKKNFLRHPHHVEDGDEKKVKINFENMHQFLKENDL